MVTHTQPTEQNPSFTNCYSVPETFLTRLRSYIYFLDKTKSDTVEQLISDIVGDTALDEPDVSLVAQTTQQFEVHYEPLPPQTLLEDIVSDLTNLRKHVAEKRLREYRALQAESNDETVAQQILVWAQQKSAPAFTTDLFA